MSVNTKTSFLLLFLNTLSNIINNVNYPESADLTTNLSATPTQRLLWEDETEATTTWSAIAENTDGWLIATETTSNWTEVTEDTTDWTTKTEDTNTWTKQ